MPAAEQGKALVGPEPASAPSPELPRSVAPEVPPSLGLEPPVSLLPPVCGADGVPPPGPEPVPFDVTGPPQPGAVSSEAAASPEAGGEEMQQLVLFTGPGGSRMAVPLGALARLEEFAASHVERAGNQWVTQYRGQILPLIREET